jgi:hypothetical protein
VFKSEAQAYKFIAARVAKGTVAGLALTAKPSVDFGGYWQRHVES